jgi:hypothetical protein
MHQPSDGGRSTASRPIDPTRFPFVRSVEDALSDRGIPLVRISRPDAHRPAAYRIESPRSEWECLVEIDEDRECVAFRSILPIEVPAGRRHEVAVLAASTNAARIVGHFAIGHRDGRVVHTSGIRLAGLAPSVEALLWTLGENLLAVDLHLAAFMLVAWTDVSAEVALRECGPVECEAA